MAEPMRRPQQSRPTSYLGISQSNAICGFAIANLLFEIGCRQNTRRGRSFLVQIDGIDLDRSGNVLEVLPAQLAKGQFQLAIDLIKNLAGNAYAAARCNAFEPGSNVDSISEDIAFILDDVADIDSYAEFDTPVRGNACVSAYHPTLNFDRTLHGFDGARKLYQHAVASCLDQAAPMRFELVIDQLSAVRLQSGKRAFLVLAHKSRIAGDVRRQDCRQPALDVHIRHEWVPNLHRRSLIWLGL